MATKKKAGKKAAKKKTAKKKATKKKVCTADHCITLKNGKSYPKHEYDVYMGQTIKFDNQNGYDVTLVFDLPIFSPPDVSVPHGGSSTRTVIQGLTVGMAYPYHHHKKLHGKVSKKAEGPPGPPDVIVAG